MGGSRKIGDRKPGINQISEGERARILAFDPARRNLRAPVARAPKHPEKPNPPTSILRRTIRNAVSFLRGIGHALRSQSRGTESSGKRRA